MIKIVLMFLPANSNICVNSRMVAVDVFPLILSRIFVPLCVPGNISLDTTHCNFILLNWVVCISINIMGLLRAELGNLETV